MSPFPYAPDTMVAHAPLEATMDSLVLSKEEIFELTHYRRASKQMATLRALGISAYLRHDNTVCVLRAEVVSKRAGDPPGPQLKSTRAKTG